MYKQVDPHLWDMYSRRATYKAYQVFKVNKYELWLLSALYGCLKTVGRPVISKGKFFDKLTKNGRFKKKLFGFYQGLLDRGMIGTYEYISYPGSESVGISDRGLQALALWREEFERLVSENPVSDFEVPCVGSEVMRYRKTA